MAAVPAQAVEDRPGRPRGRLRAVEAVPSRPPIPGGLERLVCRGTELVRRRRREEHGEPLPTGLAALDELLEGGLARGAVTELVGARSCGRMAVALSALAGVTGGGEIAALVDLGDHLDAGAARRAGVVLERLLWLRPRRLPEALEVTEMVLQTGFPLVVTDLGLPPVRGRVSPGAWMRIAREAAAHGGAVLLSSPYPLAGHTPRAVVRLGGGRGAWPGRGRGAPLLGGLELCCTVLRRRGSRPRVAARSRLAAG